MLSVCTGQVTHALLTRPPLSPKRSLDLHVLGTPPAFILSQDQTLKIKLVCYIRSDVISKYLAWFVWRSNYLFELNISAVQFSKFI